ncbi:MAG: hypothetical protein HFE86_03260 [Clostridiales bacterium]|nr:hypothetical protein [Clostridiales bacterium]
MWILKKNNPTDSSADEREAAQPAYKAAAASQFINVRKNIAIVLCAAALFCLLTGCQSKGEEEGLIVETYAIESESVPAMQVEDNVEVSMTDPVTYAYIGWENAGESVSQYVESMTAEENGFSVAKAKEAPDYTKEKGDVKLTKQAVSDENKRIALELSWYPGICTVAVSLEDAAGGANGEVAEQETLTQTEAVEMIQGLRPAVLELSGDSMDAYNVYVRNGLVDVNQEACIWLEIYTDATRAGTNAHMGTYYLSRDGKRLYSLNHADDSIKKLELS